MAEPKEERTDQVNVEEPAFPLPIQGSAGLDFSDPVEAEEGQEPTPEPGKEAASEKAEEGALTLEQLAERFPKLKVKLNVSGAVVEETLAEAVRNRQRYAGLEKNSQREKQELSRLISEMEAKIAGIDERTRHTEPAKEPGDPDDPKQFVLETVKPQIDALREALKSVTTYIEPDIGEANIKRARSIIRANGGDEAEFDAWKDSMIAQISDQAGRPVTESELKSVTPQTWAWRFATHKMANSAKPNGATEPPDSGKKVEAPAAEPKKVVIARGGPGPGNSGGGGYSGRETSTKGVLLKEAQKTGDFGKALMHFIKPGG